MLHYTLLMLITHTPYHPPINTSYQHAYLITGRSPFLVDGSEYLTFQNIMSHADGRSELDYPEAIPRGK